MSRKLTRAMVEGIPVPADGRTEVTDASQPGLRLRVTAQGARTWICRYTAKGRRTSVVLGDFPAMSVSEARRAAQRIRMDALNGADAALQRQRERAGDTFDDLLNLFEEKHASTIKSGGEVMRALRKGLASGNWIGRQPGDMTLHDAVLLIERVGANRPIAGNRFQAHLSSLMSFAAARGLITASPFPFRFRKVCQKHERPRDRVLTDDELRWLWNHSDTSPVPDCLRFIMCTGVRGEAAAAASWEEMAGDVWTVPAERSKRQRGNTDPHVTVVSPLAMLVLARRDRSGPWVFRSRQMGSHIIRSAMSKWLKRQEAAFTTHDIRRTVRARLSQLGVDFRIGELVLGHVQPKSVRTYDRYDYVPEKRAALKQLSEHLSEVVGVELPRNVEVLSHGG